MNMICDCSLNLALFKRKVSVNHFAVNKLQLFAVAKGLCACDCAVYEGHIFAVPAKIFPLDGAVSDSYIFRVPEGILRVELT